MPALDIAYDVTVEDWYSLGWELDDQGWHAPDGWDFDLGDPNEDFWIGNDDTGSEST